MRVLLGATVWTDENARAIYNSERIVGKESKWTSSRHLVDVN
jgi:hypothetical protein